MDPVDWIIPSLVTAAGVAAGVTFGLRGGSGSSETQASQLARREDLLREKERLIRAIREFQDTDGRRRDDTSRESLQALELAAAKVLRDLEEIAMNPEQAPSPETSDPSPAPSDPSGLSAEARGMLTYGFAHDIVERLSLDALRVRAEATLTNILPETGGLGETH